MSELEKKSELQSRAESAAQRFHASSRFPIVIEFAGVPKAGKTSTIVQVQAFLKRCGFRTDVVVERASVCPIRDKKHPNFNVWTACTTLAQILEKTQIPPRADDPEVLFLDRGIFDSIWWLALMERLARLLKAERELIERFLLADEWKKRISGVVVMTVLPDEALRREKGLLPVEGAQGSIMNPEVLQQARSLVDETSKRLASDFRFFTVDTSSPNYDKPVKACEAVVDKILSWVEEQLQEDILSIPKDRVLGVFEGLQFKDAIGTKPLIEAFISVGDFLPREEVEANNDRVQALPVVVVRNNKGEVLRLRRKEKDFDNPLHEQIVIWAGGHVRREDSEEGGSSLLQCAIRELHEELRLNVEADQLNLLGSVYADSGGKTSRHVALVYEWRAKTDDVSVALSGAEFFERRGSSLSGSFVSLDDLAKDVEAGKVKEKWSEQIVRGLLSGGPNISPTLF